MMIVLFLLLFLFSPPAFAQGDSTQVRPKSLDPMNRPMDELGVTGKDDTLCSDRWYSCTTYDRQQFDQKYPGQRLKDMLRFGEPDWPTRTDVTLATDRTRATELAMETVFATGWINIETGL
jgi:hypothetical protein